MTYKTKTVSLRLNRDKAEWLYRNHSHDEPDKLNCTFCEEFDRVLFKDDFDPDGLC